MHFGKHFPCPIESKIEVNIRKKAVLAFICSMILMGAVGVAALPENEDAAQERNSYSYQCNYDTDSMQKMFYVV